jgi:hypothetical protein
MEQQVQWQRYYAVKKGEILAQKQRKYRTDPEYRARRLAYGKKWRKKNAKKHRASVVAWAEANPERRKEISKKALLKFRLRTKYGLTVEQYERMLTKQNNACAICKGPNGQRAWNVDHNHRTGRVRGLLCTPCNIALGAVDDNPAILKGMIAYLKRG